MGKPTAHNYASARHLSCEGCRTRKSKCSRTFPCVSCAVRGDDCIWLDTEPAHGILQSSLEENIAEIRRLNKVVVQLQALLIERDGRGGGGGGGGALVGYNNDTTSAAAAIASGSRALPAPPLPSVVTPPTPPGLDYLPVTLHPPAGLPASRNLNPRLYGTTSTTTTIISRGGGGGGGGMMMPAPPMLRTQSDYAFGMGMMPPAPSPMMLRTQSDYGYRFPSPTSHHDAAAGATADYAPPRYTLPPMYQQQQHNVQSEDSQEVLAISPSQLSSPVMPPPPNRARSTTWPSLSSLVAADHATTSTSTSEENPFALPLPDPSQSQSQQQRFQSTATQSISTSHHHHQMPPMNNRNLTSSSPHSLKLDAAVTLAKGLAAANHRSLAMALDDEEEEEGGGDHLVPQRHTYPVAAMDSTAHENDINADDDDDLYALPIPPPGCGSATATATAAAGPATELAQLATMAVSRQGSVDFHPHHDDTGRDESLFAAPQEKEGPGMPNSQQSSSAAGIGYSSSAASAPSIVTDADRTDAEDPTWMFRLPQY